jgi:hypothetical protein
LQDTFETLTADLRVHAAGAVDVDGDGSVELVAAAAIGGARPRPCDGTWIGTFDRLSLALESAVSIPGWRLSSFTPAELDGDPGREVVAVAEPGCSTDFAGATILGIEPGDGRLLPTGIVLQGGPGRSQTGAPLVADLDADGRDEIAAATAFGTVIADTASASVVDGPATVPIALLPAAGEVPAHLVSWTAAGYRAVAVLPSARGGWRSRLEAELTADELARGRWTRVYEALRLDASAGRPPPTALIDGGVEGCPALVLPGAILGCGPAAGSRDFRSGPAWLATRPLGLVGSPGDASLLVAADLGWSPEAGLVAPAPQLAAESLARIDRRSGGPAWHAPTGRPFARGEVDGAELLGRTAFPSPATAIVPEARGSPAAVVVATSPGGRLLARTRALGPDADPPATRPDLAAVLSSAPAAAADPGAGPEAIAIWRVPAGGVGAFGEASVAMPVDAIGLPAGPADRWVVTIVALKDWGEIARPVRAVVGRGTAGSPARPDTPRSISIQAPRGRSAAVL